MGRKASKDRDTCGPDENDGRWACMHVKIDGACVWGKRTYCPPNNRNISRSD